MVVDELFFKHWLKALYYDYCLSRSYSLDAWLMSTSVAYAVMNSFSLNSFRPSIIFSSLIIILWIIIFYIL